MKKTHITFILFMVICYCVNPQGVLSNVSNLDYIFGGGDIINCKVEGNLLYTLASKLVCDEYCGNFADQNMSIALYDISNPALPIELGRKFRSYYKGNPSYENSVSYIPSSALSSPFYFIIPSNSSKAPVYFWCLNTVVQLDTILYEFSQYFQSIKIHKIISAGNFQYLKTVTLQHKIEDINGICVIDNIIYITSNSGLIIVDAKNFENPVELNSPIKDINLKGQIFGSEKILIGHQFSEMIVLDVKDPRNPFLLTRYSYQHETFNGTYAAEHYFVSAKGSIEVYDKEVKFIYSIPFVGSSGNFLIADNKMIAWSNLGIEFFEISNVLRAYRCGMFGANVGAPSDLVKNKDLLYLVNQGDGLTIIDVSDKNLPKKIGGIDFEGYSLEIKIDEHYAYIADYIKGLVIVDISKPYLPTVVSQLQSVGAAVSLALINNKVFIVNDDNELYIVDVTEKANPQIEFKKAPSRSSQKYWGRYKRIVSSKDQLWLSIYGSPFQAFTYTSQNGYKEIYIDTSYPSTASELTIADSLIFINDFHGVRIMNTNKLSFINKSDFGTSHMEESILCSAYSIKNKILYLSMSVYVASSYIKRYELTDFKNPKRVGNSSAYGWPPPKMIYDQSYLYALTPNGLRIFSADETVDVAGANNKNLPGYYSLQQNYPNPFNPSTTITFGLPKYSPTKLAIYDLLGREINVLVNKELIAGTYEIRFDAGKLTSGIYFYRLITPKFATARKLLLMK